MTLSREELEAQLSRKSPDWWSSAQNMVGRENYYHDRLCRYGIVTIDLHAGTTPMFIACRNPNGCTGVMESAGYPPLQAKPAWLGPPTFEWYRPDSVDDELEDEQTDHIMNGGLLLREIEANDAEA